MHKPSSLNRRKEYYDQVNALNRSFVQWFRAQVQADPSLSLQDGAEDYLAHLKAIEDRFLRTKGEVLTFGNGECGQLGQGTDDEDLLRIRFPRIVYSLREKHVVSIACGGLHNAVVTESGHVYTWGCNDDGALGRPGDENFPLLVAGVEGVVEVSCGDSHTVALTVGGSVFGWGCFTSKEGEKMFSPSSLGGDDIFGQRNEPALIVGLTEAVEVRAGGGFNLARRKDGTVYSWGLGDCGQLSRDVCSLDRDQRPSNAEIGRSHLTPRPMQLLRDDGEKEEVRSARAIGCGNYHSFVVVVDNEHDVYGCGLNNYGQIGLGDDQNFDAQPFLVPLASLDGKGITHIEGGMHHSTCLSRTKGLVYAWGRGDAGQLGFLPQERKEEGEELPPGWSCAQPTLVPFPEEVRPTMLSSGSSHNLVLSEGGSIFSWGFGEELALGHGEERDEVKPKKMDLGVAGIDGFKIKQVVGGGQHSAILGERS